MTDSSGNQFAKVFHGQHTGVGNKYARDSALTVILLTKPLFEGPEALLCITFDQDAQGTRNATRQLTATATLDGDTLTVQTHYYRFTGVLQGDAYEGQYHKPDGSVAGSFTLSSQPVG